MPSESTTPTADAFAAIMAARQVVNAWNTSGGLRIHNARLALADLARDADRIHGVRPPPDTPAIYWQAFIAAVGDVVSAETHELKVTIRALAHATDLVSVDRSPPAADPDPAVDIPYRPGIDD